MQRSGFVLIADITGFTSYLSESEIEHAQGTLTDLLELLVETTPAPLVVSQLEGDAVMSYAFQEGFVTGQSFLEALEDVYLAFRRAIELKVLNNTCKCNACANVSRLDVKFFVHFGSFVIQPVGDRDQLLGSDVNLIHRLLKNSVTADTGIEAYVLCTLPAAEALGLDMATVDMIEHTEEVSDFGELTVLVRDMHQVYESRSDEGRYEYEAEDVLGRITTEVALRQEQVWDYLSRPEFRRHLVGSDRQEVQDRKRGMIGEGSTYLCYHGDMAVTQLILEWTPFDRVVVRQTSPFMGRSVIMVLDWRLTPLGDRTRLDSALVYEGGGLLKRVGRVFEKLNRRKAQGDLETFRDVIERDHNSRDAPSGVELSPEQFHRAAAESLEAGAKRPPQS